MLPRAAAAIVLIPNFIPVGEERDIESREAANCNYQV